MELIIFSGLQAAGKTTFYQMYFAATHLPVSKDRMRNNKNRDRRQMQLITEALQQKHSVVVDNTNPRIEDRAALIEIGRSYQAKIIGYYFISNVEESCDRNRQRSGKSQVPDIAIYATIKRLVPPSYAEGFDELFYVKIAENNTFKITKI